jgi:anti-sigma28 factor (negative regulator of flagellin synthesis)
MSIKKEQIKNIKEKIKLGSYKIDLEETAKKMADKLINK